MFFLPRNNTLYNYIAHTKRNRRYGATIFFLIFFVMCSFYGIYKPLIAHISFYQTQSIQLKEQCKELEQLETSMQEYVSFIEKNKKEIDAIRASQENNQSHCYSKISQIVNVIADHGIILQSYSSCKEKVKDWYSNYSSQFAVVGSLPKLLACLESLEKNSSFFSISHIVFKRKEKDLFQMNFQIHFFVIKK